MNVATPLAGQNILVTGASGGIGAAIVEKLLAEGARVIVHYGKDRDAAENFLNRFPESVFIIQADISQDTGPFELWGRAETLVGRIHAIVNNAGMRSEVSIEADLETWKLVWQREFQVNFFAAADLCKEALRHFRRHGGGKIINMGSRAAQRGYAADAMPYGASKAALINLTKSIARSFGHEGVIAVNIAPGWVRTDMADQFVAQHGKQAAVADIPVGEMAEPIEVAELVAFALRPSQISLNGATLDVNSGSYIR